MATHSSILAWKILWSEEPDGLQSLGLQNLTRLKQHSTHTRTSYRDISNELHTIKSVTLHVVHEPAAPASPGGSTPSSLSENLHF